MSERPAPASNPRRLLRMAVQFLGFLVGIALIAWCVQKAFGGEHGERLLRQLREAPPWMLATLGAATMVSLFANGSLFFALIRPVAPLRFVDIQAVNLLASFLNYAPLPFRLGLAARVGYHWRVDGLSLTTIATWLVAAAVSMVVAFAAGAAALPLAAKAGLGIYAVIVVALAAVGVFVASFLAGWPFLARRLKGAERTLTDRTTFGAATGFRLLDMAAWALRMVVAAKVLDLPLTTTEAALLGLAAVVASMNPLGRFGFREAAVAWLASSLFAGRMCGDELEAPRAPRARVESAAEGAITIPLGAAGALWCWRRWREARAERRSAAVTDP